MEKRPGSPIRLAIVVSHPIQYYVPLYQRLAARDDVQIKVFYTWHAGEQPVFDRGFDQAVSWDLPMTQGYDHVAVPNTSSDPGTHHFLGLRNPALVSMVMEWKPDAVHVTGWAWLSHLLCLRRFRALGVPVLFRGDSHLLDSQGPPWRSAAKRLLLRKVFSWPSAFLYTGRANRQYFEAFGVPGSKLYHCPHSIDVARFAEPAADLEAQARRWRDDLGIEAAQVVLLFAGKLEPKKQPLELMEAVRANTRYVLVLAGSGELAPEVTALAATAPARFRLLPFQNQSRMPVVYRVGDVFMLPSVQGETWGLAVNEAIACGRPVVVSDRVGCALDVVDTNCGRTFAAGDVSAMMKAVDEMTQDPARYMSMRQSASARAWAFDLRKTEAALIDCLGSVVHGR